MTPGRRSVVRVGTRGSVLARAQTGRVVAALQALHPGACLETVTVRTSGDRDRREVVGAFVKELQETLLSHEVDIAVHSMKDLPTERPPGLALAAVPPREDPRDALLSPTGCLADLPPGSVVGTGSVRRTAQLRGLRADLSFKPLVGNVDTRLSKLESGDYRAIVVAWAGMLRLDYNVVDGALKGRGLAVDLLDLDVMLPAPGQGALALECRADDPIAQALLTPMNDPASETAVRAERAFLAALGGGCQTPVAAYATVQGSACVLRGLAAAPDGSRAIRGEAAGAVDEPEALGKELAARLLKQGAGDLLSGRHA